MVEWLSFPKHQIKFALRGGSEPEDSPSSLINFAFGGRPALLFFEVLMFTRD